jgi:hypothetical protein
MSTRNQTFLMMKHYKNIGFTVKAKRFMGLGERYSNLILEHGEYTMFADNPSMTSFDNGYGDWQGPGYHPVVFI